MAHDNKNIPEGWTETALGEFIDVKHGYAFSGEFITDIENKNILLTPGNFLIGGGWKDGKKFYSGSDIPSEYILKSGDIVVTMTDLSKDGDTLGYPAVIPNHTNLNFLHNQRVGLIQFTGKEINKDYLYWKLRTKHYQKTVVNSATGSTVRHTSPGRIKEYKFFLPPLSEQGAIADMLSSLDAKIELLREQNETLEKTAQTLFHEWFGRYSVENPEELPEGWRVGKVSECMGIIGGGTPKTTVDEYWGGDISWFSVVDCPGSGVFVLETEKNITKSGLENSSTKILPKYTTIITARGTVGKLALTGVEMAMNQSCYGLRSSIDAQFYLFLLIQKVIEILKSRVHGAVFDTITRDTFSGVDVIIPSITSIKEFEKVIKPFFEKMFNNYLEIQSLSRTRDTLLPKLMSGEVRV